jgi:hypothetical protein
MQAILRSGVTRCDERQAFDMERLGALVQGNAKAANTIGKLKGRDFLPIAFDRDRGAGGAACQEAVAALLNR